MNIGNTGTVIKVTIGKSALTRDLVWCECGRGLSRNGKWEFCPKCGSRIDQESYALACTEAERNGAAHFTHQDADLINENLELCRSLQAAQQEREKNERWETGFRNIVTVLVGPRVEFEIRDIVESVKALQQLSDERGLALKYALQWIDSVPKCDVLPTMPGFDRDWADALSTTSAAATPPEDSDTGDTPPAKEFKPEPGWLKRQTENVERDVSEWPVYMKEAAGFEKQSTQSPPETALGYVERNWESLWRSLNAGGLVQRQAELARILQEFAVYCKELSR